MVGRGTVAYTDGVWPVNVAAVMGVMFVVSIYGVGVVVSLSGGIKGGRSVSEVAATPDLVCLV